MLSSFGHLSAQKKKLTLKIYFLFLASLLIAIYILEPSLFKPIKPHRIRLQPEKIPFSWWKQPRCSHGRHCLPETPILKNSFLGPMFHTIQVLWKANSSVADNLQYQSNLWFSIILCAFIIWALDGHMLCCKYLRKYVS